MLIPSAERKAMVDSSDQVLSITSQCDLLGLCRSSFYYKAVGESEENLAIMRYLDEQYFETPFYGVERLLVSLGIKGYKINAKRLRRLMKLVGWQTLYPAPKTTNIDPTKYKYPYLLRNLAIERKNQVWGIDITYIPMKRGFLYLFAIIDLHTRYVVGWSISNTMTAEWCVETISEAIEKYGKPEIMNSDQGSQFTSELYTKFLTEKGVQISMDGKGRAIDNIFIERLWRSVKYEHVYLYVYEDGLSLWKGLNSYFEFYNQVRPHQSLEYSTPSRLYLAA